MFSNSLLDNDIELNLEEILTDALILPELKIEDITKSSSHSTTVQLYKKLCAAILDEEINSPFITEPDPKVLDHKYLLRLAKYFIPEAIEVKTSEPVPMATVRKRKRKKEMMKESEVAKAPKMPDSNKPTKEIKILKAVGPFFMRPAFPYSQSHNAGVRRQSGSDDRTPNLSAASDASF